MTHSIPVRARSAVLAYSREPGTGVEPMDCLSLPTYGTRAPWQDKTMPQRRLSRTLGLDFD